jgi:two-component system LytT family response regulator
MLRAIVVDDEKPSREVICNYLREYCEDVKVVAKASSVKGAISAVSKHKPDVLFLDIELGDGKGFDIFKKTETVDFKIVFITAYSDYAIKAFRVNAVDYLLKPVKIDELKAAVEKVRNSNNTKPVTENIIAAIEAIAMNNSVQPTILIPHVKGYDVIKVSDIIMCKADGYCTNFHLINNIKKVSSKNLKQYEELLTGQNFIRVHHSFIVNINHVCSYTKQGEIVLTEGIKSYLGDTYKEAFVKRLGKKLRG